MCPTVWCVDKEVVILLNIKISGHVLAINGYTLPQTPDIFRVQAYCRYQHIVHIYVHERINTCVSICIIHTG